MNGPSFTSYTLTFKLLFWNFVRVTPDPYQFVPDDMSKEDWNLERKYYGRRLWFGIHWAPQLRLKILSPCPNHKWSVVEQDK